MTTVTMIAVSGDDSAGYHKKIDSKTQLRTRVSRLGALRSQGRCVSGFFVPGRLLRHWLSRSY